METLSFILASFAFDAVKWRSELLLLAPAPSYFLVYLSLLSPFLCFSSNSHALFPFSRGREEECWKRDAGSETRVFHTPDSHLVSISSEPTTTSLESRNGESGYIGRLQHIDSTSVRVKTPWATFHNTFTLSIELILEVARDGGAHFDSEECQLAGGRRDPMIL